MLARLIVNFFRSEAAGGILLMLAAVAAMIVANSSLAPAYDAALLTKLAVLVDGEGLEKPLILWINDGLMAIFFFMVGLELKRELMEGKLKHPRDVVLPGMAAVGGMAVPALIYLYFNMDDPITRGGWAIPAATDIAFALGILALIGARAPASLKVFLLTLAILDDMGAILIIALFYTAELKPIYLALAVMPLAGMLILNVKGAHRTAPTLLLGVALWFFVLRSGVHATLAGVITAFCIPLTDRWNKSPLHALERGVTPYVLFLIVPIFAFANAGVSLGGLSWSDVVAPVPLGIALGLILGKQVGVFGITWVMVRAGWAKMPYGATWLHIYGVSCLAGIGFTMSLFIGGLSFNDPALMNQVRFGVLTGSIFSAVLGYGALIMASTPAPAKTEPKRPVPPDAEPAE